MKDGIFRRLLKKVALTRFRADLAFTRLVLRMKGEPRFKLGGSCNGCGRCCDSSMIQVGFFTWYLRSFRWMVLTWHRVVNGFTLVGEHRKERLFVFQCSHYDAVQKRCDSYDSRPGMCRDYPHNLMYMANPDFIAECSYYAVNNSGDRLRDELQKLPLPPEKKEELLKKMHLRK